MLFNTPEFVLVIIIYLSVWFLIPPKCRKIQVLLFSYFFAYMLGGTGTVISVLSVTLLTYCFGILIEKSRRPRLMAGVFCTLLVLLLFYDKYTDFTLNILNYTLKVKTPKITVITMVGVSYYAFSAISYIIDIYRGNDEADRNILDVAIWISFFAKIIAGPIERHNCFKKRLNALDRSGFDMERVKRGFLITAFGYFQKIIIADRLSLYVDTVYSDIGKQMGFTVLLAIILYSLQIYYDFAGYSMIAYGIAYIMDLKISRNFDKPYLACSITEFWKKWHISLSSWLRDYIYIPLGGNRKGKLRQYFNLLATFLISGIWHGAGLSFIVWGGIHGLAQVFEKLFGSRFKFPKVLKGIITFGVVSVAWIFFRADTVRDAINIIRSVFCWNPGVITDGTLLGLGMDIYDWIVLSVSLAAMIAVESLQARGVSLYNRLQEHGTVIRWAAYYVIIAVLLVFGKYGPSFDMNNFIYFRF